MKSFKIILLVLLGIIPAWHEALPYDTNVHEAISENAFNQSVLKSGYLKNIGISVTDKFDDLTPLVWIKSGSVKEDADPRYLNHFYDPTTGKGLNNLGLSEEPSLQWGKNSSNNVYSWKWARDAYYKALTDSNPNFRNTYFSYVFTDLGQIMHLIQDLAVPAHVRNDAHPYPPEWICRNCLQDQRDMYEKYTKTATLTYDGYPAVDITTFNIFDSFWINGGKGLSEYTNSNFLSRDTNFDNAAYTKYNSPVAIGETVTTQQAYDPYLRTTLDVWVKSYQGYATDRYSPEKSAPIGHLTTFSYFDYEMNRLWGKRVYSLNKSVHKDYADFLIPRAIGYSAGLLNYFFRGQMDATGVETKSLTGSTGITVDVKNTTPNEDMSGGTFVLSYRYKAVGSMEYTYGKSNTVASGTLAYNAEIPYQHIFYFEDAIPVDARDKQYILVFYGTLGNEEGAVVGKTHIQPRSATP